MIVLITPARFLAYCCFTLAGICALVCAVAWVRSRLERGIEDGPPERHP